MAATQTKPYYWLKQLSPSLLRLNHIPLMGRAPAFPWENLSDKIAEHFDLNPFSLQISDGVFLTSEEIPSSLGTSNIYFDLSFSTLAGTFHWVISKENLSQIMAILLNVEISYSRGIDESFFEGFKNFLGHELLFIFNQIPFDKKLDPHLKISDSPPSEHILRHDIFFDMKGHSFTSHILLTESFLQGWRARYASDSTENKSSSLLENCRLPIQLIGGHISLFSSQWKNISAGDLLILDQCTVDPVNKEGQVTLIIHQTPFFNASYQNNKIKILEKDVFQKVPSPMIDKNNTDEDDDHLEDDDTDFDDIDFDDDDDFDDEDDFDEEFDEDEEEESKSHDDALDDDEEGSESSSTQTTKEDHTKKAAQVKETPPEKNTSEKPASSSKEAIRHVDDIPLTISIEVGRLEMTVKKLSDLQPGNLLELDPNPENDVDLVINGSRVGRGELLRIGENLAVRVLELS